MDNTKRVLKICLSDWNNENRDKRELSVCEEFGAKSIVLAKGEIKDRGRIDNVSGFEVHRYTTRPIRGKIIPNSLNRIISIFEWATYAAKLKPEVISGHDITGLTIGWISNWFKPIGKKAKLVYDSHEFEIGRNVRRNKLQTWIVMNWERFLIKRCIFSIMVNDCIADEVQRIHKLKERPIVVRSTPDYWNLEENKVAEIRSYLKKKLPDCDIICMYHGAITSGRGIEETIELISRFDNVGLVILGNSQSETYLAQLVNIVETCNVEKRVYFHNAVPIEKLKYFVAAVDIGLVLTAAPVKSYYFSLPNKFFENIQACTPVIATALPEVKKIVDKYLIGEICSLDGTVADINSAQEALSKLIKDKDLYKRYKDNLKRAKCELCWENEKKILKDAYSSVLL